MGEPKWEPDILDGKVIWRIEVPDEFGAFVLQRDDGRWRHEAWCLRSLNMIYSEIGNDLEECKKLVEQCMRGEDGGEE